MNVFEAVKQTVTTDKQQSATASMSTGQEKLTALLHNDRTPA